MEEKDAIKEIFKPVNKLLGISGPLDLVIPPSPELHNAVLQEAEEVERAFARTKEKPKKEQSKPVKEPSTMESPGTILTMTQVMEGIARKKATAPAAEKPTEGQVIEMEKARKRPRRRKKAGT